MTDRADKLQDEIELMDMLRVLWKWKYLIILGPLLFAVAAAFISLKMPKVYKIDVLLKPGVVEVDSSGKEIHVVSFTNIKSLIELGVLDNKIIKHFSKDNSRFNNESIRFDVSRRKGSNILKISYNTKSVESGIKILNSLPEILSAQYRDKIEYYRTKLQREIELKRNKLSDLADMKNINKIKINRITKRTDNLNEKIRQINHLDNKLEEQIDSLVSLKSDENLLAAHFCSDLVHKTRELEDKYRNEYLDYLSEKELAQLEVKRIQAQIEIVAKD
jgi:hypothetical protein